MGVTNKTNIKESVTGSVKETISKITHVKTELIDYIYQILYYNRPRVKSSFTSEGKTISIDNCEMFIPNDENLNISIDDGETYFIYTIDEIIEILDAQIYLPAKNLISTLDKNTYKNLFFAMSPICILYLYAVGDLLIDAGNYILVNNDEPTLAQRLGHENCKFQPISKLRNTDVPIDFDFAIVSTSNEELIWKTNIEIGK